MTYETKGNQIKEIWINKLKNKYTGNNQSEFNNNLEALFQEVFCCSMLIKKEKKNGGEKNRYCRIKTRLTHIQQLLYNSELTGLTDLENVRNKFNTILIKKNFLDGNPSEINTSYEEDLILSINQLLN